MDNQNKIKHHYCPRGYLKNFLTPSRTKVAVFDKENKYKPYTEKTPKNIMFEDDFYSFINLENKLDRSAETDIFEIIDNNITSTFEKIRKLELEKIVSEEYVLLTQFIVLQWLRGPRPRKDLFDYISSRGIEYSKEEIRQIWLTSSFKMAGKMMDFALSLPTVFVISPEDCKFITSDTPYGTEHDYKNQNIQRFMPLSSRVGILMMDGKEDVFGIKVSEAKKDHVKVLNERVVSNAVRYIIAENEDILRENIDTS